MVGLGLGTVAGLLGRRERPSERRSTRPVGDGEAQVGCDCPETAVSSL